MKSKQKFTFHLSWVKCLSVLVVITIAFSISILFLPSSYHTTGFRTVTDLQQYTATLDEWISMENDNVLFPGYDNYYKQKYTETFWRNWKSKLNGLLVKFNLKPAPLFTSAFFKELLIGVTNYRLEQDWHGKFIQKAEVNANSKLVVFGVTQGALHSLVRYLGELKKLDILNEDFTLKNKDYFIILLGNVVNRSPYTLDIFSVVLKLLEKNPDNVIYLRGTNEYFDYWKDHTLRRELEFRCKHLSNEKIPLAKEVNTFFETLPLKFYVTFPYSSDVVVNYFRISPYIGDKFLLGLFNDVNLATFLNSKNTNTLKSVNLENIAEIYSNQKANPIILRAVIKDIIKRYDYVPMDGLRLLAPEDGVITWTILSNPMEPNRKALNFYYDAFTVITPGKGLEDCTITLYNRDIRDKQNLFKKKTYLFFQGKELP